MPFNANADLFRAAALFVSKDETRFYIKGVCIQPHKAGGVTITATDGHRLFSAYDVEGYADRDYIIALDRDALKACKMGKGESVARRVKSTTDAEPVAITRGDAEMTMALSHAWEISGATFPDWRRILPKDCEGATVADFYNSAYLASFADAAEILSTNRAIRVTATDRGSPALIRFSGVADAFGVLMPMRSDNTEPGDTVPDFARASY